MKIKKQFLNIAATLSLFLVLGTAAAAQTTRQMTVTIPFEFSVGKTALPAGTYTLYRTSTNRGDEFLLRNADGHAKVVFNAQQVQAAESQAVARLEFRRYDDKYFLASIWAGGSSIGRELLQSSQERETARDITQRLTQKSVQPEIVSIRTQ